MLRAMHAAAPRGRPGFATQFDGSGSGSRDSLMGVLRRLRETRRVLAPWAAAGAPVEVRPEAAAAERHAALVRELEELRALLATLLARGGDGETALVEALIERRVRDVVGRLHEAVWLSRQTAKRAASVRRMTTELAGTGRAVVEAVDSLRSPDAGTRSRAPMSAVAA